MSVSRRSPPSSGIPRPGARWADPPRFDATVVDRLSEALRLPRALCAVLVARGVTEVEDAKRFLRPQLEQLHDPALLAGGSAAAERLTRALRDGERIFVHGDYDVDGICGAALYTRFLRAQGGDVVSFVPHRLRDGYDFTEAGLHAARDAGASLILTADCGTVAHEAVAHARRDGFDVVVSDHHTVADTLPDALAVVNPKRPDCAYPGKDLCGTGVAYKLCKLVARNVGTDPALLDEYLDLLALATVADLVPLQGENRVLVRLGLKRFARTHVEGMGALLEVAGVDAATVDAGKLAFGLAPRINAAGRIGESADALRLLLTDDPREAAGLAREMDAFNRERQEEDKRTLSEALELLEADYDPERDYGVVLARDGWHPGVIGIVASRVVERIHRPVVMVALDGDEGRGSARSIPGFHLYDALAACRAHLGRFGGHRQAAGMDVARDAVPALRASFNAEARNRLREEDLRPVLRPDLELTLSEVDLELIHWLEYLGPHGMGNPRPLFLVSGVTVERPRRVGESHLKLTLRAGRAALDGIGFGLAEDHPPDALGRGPYDVLLKLERNEWHGVARPQGKLLDLRPAIGTCASPEGS